MNYMGDERFIINGEETDIRMSDFWKWAYPDFLTEPRRSLLSNFIVASSIGLSGGHPSDRWNGYRVQIESASYMQSEDGEHPCHISYPAPKLDADVCVYCLYKGMSDRQNPLDLDLWEFFVFPSDGLTCKNSVTLPRLMESGVWQSDYYGITDGIEKALRC